MESGSQYYSIIVKTVKDMAQKIAITVHSLISLTFSTGSLDKIGKNACTMF